MIPPDRNHLEALAGWSLTARFNASDRQHLALCKFGESCGELSAVIDDLPAAKQVAATDCETNHHPPARKVAATSYIPEEVRNHLQLPDEKGACTHRFDIKTQTCLYCGLTYLKAHGRKPELF
jgi:hypothetical protein